MLNGWLCMPPGKYTVFGQVIDGLEVLDRTEKVPSGQARSVMLIAPSLSLPALLVQAAMYHHVCWHIFCG